MNFQFYLEKLLASETFENFKTEFPDAFLCSGFFTIDKEGRDNQQHIDYFVPSTNKLYSFKLNENPIVMIQTETMGDFTANKVNDNFDFDLEEVESSIEKEIENRSIKNKIQKLIFSLQNSEGKDFLLGTIFLSGLGLVKVMFDISEKEITEFEKKSFFDMISITGKKKQ